MKEFSAQTGGRYTYADDLENLQELALAFSEIFDDCGNFIVSGCEVSNNAISAGYVFINGKLRYFNGATGLAGWPQYIYELNRLEAVPYENGGTKTGRKNYGCAIGNSVPTTPDEVTGELTQAIAIDANGGLRMKDAFFGKYALLLNPDATDSQTVNSGMTFSKAVQVNGELTANNKIIVRTNEQTTQIQNTGTSFEISTLTGSNRYRFTFEDGSGFNFYIGDVLVASIGASSIRFNKPVSADSGAFGGLVLQGNHLYQGTANINSEININMGGYQGGKTQYRDTHIGNGCGAKIISVTGATGVVSIFGATEIAAGAMDGLVLKANLAQDSDALTNAIAWKDSGENVMARVGFVSEEDQLFSIASGNYNISITGHSTVNIGPAIMEGGVLLSDKYAQQANMTQALSLKANATDVYSIPDADKKFGTKAGGLLQFVNDKNTKEVCRSQIGAANADDLDLYAKKDQLLADMATTDKDKETVRNNIGAAPAVKDTGWIHLRDSLYIRQVGNQVFVQGISSLPSGGHGKIFFTLPDEIDSPEYACKMTVGINETTSWTCKIQEHARDCVLSHPVGSYSGVIISFSYLV